MQKSVRQVPIAVLAGLGAAFSAWMGWLGIPVAHVALVIGLLLVLPLVIPAVLVISGLGSEHGRSERMRVALLTTLTGIFCVLMLQVPGFLAAMATQPWHMAEAKQRCEKLASDLEQWRNDHGHYPEDIEGTELVTAVPDVLGFPRSYRRQQDGTFELDLSTGFMSGMTYMSRDKVWTYWDW